MHVAGSHDAIELRDERTRALGAELADADVFRVAHVVGELFVYRPDEAASNVHFHFLRRVRAVQRPCARQQGVLEAGVDEIGEQLRVEQNVAVEHHEAVIQRVAGEPQRIQTVGRRMNGIDENLHARRARAPHVGLAEARHDGDGAKPGRQQRVDLPFEKSQVADARQALRPFSHDAAKPPSSPRRQNHRPHAPSDNLSAATFANKAGIQRHRRRPASALIFST